MISVLHWMKSAAFVSRGNIYELFRYLMNDDPYLDKTGMSTEGKFPVQIEKPAQGALKVGFIGNFTLPPNELKLIEPDLGRASDTGLRILFDKMQVLLDGKCIRLFSRNLMNGKIHFTFYILPYDTAHLEMVHHFGKKRNYIAKIQEAVNRLAQDGVTHVSLGAHTSVLTSNGLCLAEPKWFKNSDREYAYGCFLSISHRTIFQKNKWATWKSGNYCYCGSRWKYRLSIDRVF